MAKVRSWEGFSCKNPNFVGVCIVLVLSFGLLVYQFFILEDKVGLYLIIIGVFFLISMWSYVASVCCNPGKVPAYYGLYSQRIPGQRKYCLICRDFKPERAHHCSNCKQCVLNLQHHCPWINNCVGFDNRKYFLLFVTYLLIAMTLALIWMIIIFVEQISSKKFELDFHMILKIALFLKYLCLVVILSIFTFTHYRYVVSNTTTIEQLLLERKKKATENKEIDFAKEIQHNYYDINCYYNWTQVFGDNPFYWLLPTSDGNPLRGGGIVWDKNNSFLKSERGEEMKLTR